MDVRCAQCQAEYELDDTLVAERGTAVCCTRCGFRFRAYRPAGVAAAPERWTVRTQSGSTLTFLSLRELQEAIVLRRVGPQDALMRGQSPARSIASIVEFRPLFEAAKRGSETLAKARPSMPTPVGLGGPPLSGSAGTGSNPSLSTPARGLRRSLPTPLGSAAPSLPTPSGAVARPSGVLPAAPPPATLLGATPSAGVPSMAPATRVSFPVSPGTVNGDEPTMLNFAAPGATGTPPAALVVPRGGLRERPSMPSLTQTIPFDTATQGVAREAFEAALRGEGVEGEIVLPGGLGSAGPSVGKNDVTEPLFTGQGQGGARPNLTLSGVGREAFGLSSSANSLRAFVASDVVTPPDGSSRHWPEPAAPAGGEAKWGPGNAGAPFYEAGRSGAGGQAVGGQGSKRPGAEAAWVPPPRPPSPPLRWFVAGAVALALAGGLVLRKGFPLVGRSSASISTPPVASQVEALVASGDAALAGSDYNGALEAYAKAKALAAGDARASLGTLRAEVLRSEGAWWRSRLVPADQRAGARLVSTDELVDAAGRVAKALGEAPAAEEDGGALALRVNALRLTGDLAAARALGAPLRSAAGVEAAYAWAMLRLAEAAPLDAEALGRLREAASDVAPGRVGVALAYALGLAGEAGAARAEIDRMAAAPKPVAALSELRAWLDARRGAALGSTAAAAAAAGATAAPLLAAAGATAAPVSAAAGATAAPVPVVPARRRGRPKGAPGRGGQPSITRAEGPSAPTSTEAKAPNERAKEPETAGSSPALLPAGASSALPSGLPSLPGGSAAGAASGALPSGTAPSKPADEGDAPADGSDIP